jgi:N-methylhydantoinase B
MTTAPPAVDVVTAEIIRNGLTSAALEMNKTLVRTAYNPLLYEVQDFGLGIVSAEGLLWAEAPGVTVFLGAMPDTVKTGIETWGADFAEGDVLIANDPFLTGTHISDTSVYMPVFHEDELVAFAIATAHWADIGGKTPGGWCPDSTDVYQEGLCFTHQKLVDAGTPNRDLWGFIETNVRFPTTVRGDLDAQIAACRQGAARVQALCSRYGPETVRESMSFAIEQTDAAIRREIEKVPDGSYSASIALDHDGVLKDVRRTVAVTLTVAGDRIRVSFDGTGETAHGPINMPTIGTRSSVRAAVKGLLMPTDPTNEGHFLALDFDLPPGLMVTPQRPAPCDSYGYLGVVLMELTIRAMSQAIPERCPAGSYQLFGVYLFRVDPRDGTPFIFIDPIDGGHGARPDGDGPSLIFLADGDTPNTPIEIVETRYPIRCDRHAFLPGVEGAGTYRGGLGIVRDFRVLEQGTYMQCAIENTKDMLARGLDGGRDADASRIVVWPGTEKEHVMQERTSFFGPLEPDDVVSVRSGGGGGWGSPSERDPEQVAQDVRDELLTKAEARRLYCVVLEDSDSGVRVEPEETSQVRRELAGEDAGKAGSVAAGSTEGGNEQ